MARQKRAHGAGSVRQLPSGSWQGRILLPTGQRYTVTRPTKRNVERDLHDMRIRAEKGIAPADPRMKVGDWLDRWLEESVGPHREPRTYVGYAQDIRLYLKPALGTKRLAQLSVDDVQRMLNAMQDRGLSPRSLQKVRGTLRRALNVAVKRDVLYRNVAALVEVPTVRPHETKALTAEDARAILAAVRGTQIECLVLVTLALGLRMGEVLGLTWECVDLGKGEVRIEATLHKNGELRQPKTPRSVRLIPLPDPLLRALGAHRVQQLVKSERRVAGARELVFTSARGTPLDGPNVTHRFQAMLRSHGLPVIRFHDLRHGSASFLMSLGVPLPVAMAILGHAQASTLLNIYAHANQAEMRAAMEALGELLGG